MAGYLLQQAHKLDPDRAKVGGWYASEKLDGTRCFWDGGLSRDIATQAVPWANLDKSFKPVASGLWSRYGNVIAAPDWFLNQLPPYPLDGELHCGRRNFQKTRSIVGKHTPDPVAWEAVEFAVFDSPSLLSVFKDRKITGTNYSKVISYEAVRAWMNSLDDSRTAEYVMTPPDAKFEEVLVFLRENLELEGRVYMHGQTKLHADEEIAQQQLDHLFEKVTEAGGEGLVVRHPYSVWEPKRTRNVLKYKPTDDDEGIVRGFTSGRETAKGSKLLGMIGALILDYKGKRLELAGLTDDEREFATTDMSKYATLNPGKDMPVDFIGKHFRPGQKVTFTYRELSDDGLPKEARFLRERGDE
jgi:DNA ligase-1